MTEPADPPPFRHPAVYRTVRGLALSSGRAPPAAALAAAPAQPTPLAPVPVAPAAAAPATVAAHVEPEPDDAAGLYDARRYSEPND